MNPFRHLQLRRERLQQAQSSAADRAAEQTRLAAQVQADAALLRDLLQDARYVRYAQLLTDTRASLQRELAGLAETEREPGALALGVARLQGRIQQLTLLLDVPEHFAALAAAPEDAGRTQASNPGGAPRVRVSTS